MFKALSLTVLFFNLFSAHAEMPAEIDPGNCEVRILLVNIHPDYREAIRAEIVSKGWIDSIREHEAKNTWSHWVVPHHTLTVGLRYNLNMPTSNFASLVYRENIPYQDAYTEEHEYFNESTWTLGNTTRTACEATKDLVKSLPRCVAWNSPLLKKQSSELP